MAQKIVPFLWFDGQAEEAARFYVSLFKRSKIGKIARYGDGKVMTVAFTIEGQPFVALNGGPHYQLTPAFSLSVDCKTQREIDGLWSKLSADPKAEQCGWLKDKFGLSWQIVPTGLGTLMAGKDQAKAGRVMQALMQMKKLDIAALEAAAKAKAA